eukprot:CAMPEP_0172424096 /NCGR_PEP_ID=MMETSP1064-20121228/21234_1 /TAXON_ID=202472 /ORGANISM="Aulacoseira subarctica , Strain CCAP 1002/5" /LENGTH=268 /DNA_ID=CAMNT_0013165851 /DNA_START=73 /DNA_END=876 /DNA_ORIENTATION=-
MGQKFDGRNDAYLKAQHRSTTDLLVTPLHTSSSSGSIFKPQDRAQFLNTIATLATLLSPINSRASAVVTGIKDGNLPDLPTEAVRSYLQYRIPLQISVDYYLFELQDKVKNIEDWGDVSQLFVSSGARGGQGQPNRMERDFINPMRILELAMPPEDAEKLQAARNTFEQAMQLIQKATVGIRRDLPIEISSKDIAIASKGWEDGRVALNQYIVALNSATGLTNELRTIPASDDQQISQYGRSPRKFFDLLKKSKQCQNRGGPTIAQGW